MFKGLHPFSRKQKEKNLSLIFEYVYKKRNYTEIISAFFSLHVEVAYKKYLS